MSGSHLADLLSEKLLYPVQANEPYYTPGCTSPSQCVFPNASIPPSAWSEPSTKLLKYIPAPNLGNNSFTSASEGKILRDDKASFSVDGNSQRSGLISGYYSLSD